MIVPYVGVLEVRSTPQLVLFVTSASTNIDVDENSFFKNIRNELSLLFTESLPSYMIPRAIVFMDNIPLTSNGKVNRSQLASFAVPNEAYLAGNSHNTDGNNDTNQSMMPIVTEKELMVKAIWVEILDIPEELIHGGSNFFELGGDSMSSLQFVGIARRNGWKISVREIFDTPGLHDVANRMEKLQAAGDLVIPGAENSNTTVIWLHGLGETPDTWESFVHRMNNAMNTKIKWILPLGTGLNWLGNLEKSVENIEKIIARESNDNNVKKIILGGFSQGGAVAPFVAKLFNNKYDKIQGVISLSAWVLDEFQEKKDATKLNIPLFIAHGTMDEQVPYQQSEEFIKFWNANDAMVNRKLYPGMGHTCNGNVEEDLKQFLLKNV